jgi:hypothetical protein
MNKISKILVVTACLASVNAFAGYRKLADCNGRTDKNFGAKATLFVNQTTDTQGLVVVNLERGGLVVSDTRVDWNANPQGYPRFFDNDFDLDIVINDRTPAKDDILVGDQYVAQLNCVYTP